MEYIRKKISLENYTIRSIPKDVLLIDSEGKTFIDENNPKYFYGKVPDYVVDDNGNFVLDSFGQKIVNTINIDLFITQNIDDMGLFTDSTYTPSDNELTTKPENFNSFQYGRLAGAPLSFYLTGYNTFSGNTDDGYLNQVSSYRLDSSGNPIFVPFLNTSDNTKHIFNGVISEDSEKTKYKIGADATEVENYQQGYVSEILSGIELTTYKNRYTKTIDEYGKKLSYYKTIFQSNSGGWNIDNTTLSAVTKKEEYLGIVFQPEVKSVVFINRGVADIFERHSILSEIKTTNDIDVNRGGYIRT